MDLPKPTLPHPKIKPILIQRFASGRNQNEKHLRKYSISSSKELNVKDHSQLRNQFSKTLVSQHRLSKLQYEFNPLFFPKNSPLPTPITHFFSHIKNLSSLADFNLKFCPSFRLDTKACLEPLMMSLASLNNLSHLNIIFSSGLSDPKLLKMLFKYLKRIKTLTNLSISGWILKDFSTPHRDGLSLHLRKLKQLHSLELSFNKRSKLYEEIINELALTLPKLPLLTKIGIHFDVAKESIPPNAISNLFSCLKNMKASDISLDIWYRPIKNSKDPISQGLSLLDPSRTQKLRLQSYQYFYNNCLIQFSEALKNFTSLHTLQFSLVFSNHSYEEGIAALTSALSGLVSLSSLTILLNSSYCKKFVEAISVPFKYLKNLTNLDLQIYGYTEPAHHEEIQQLFSNLRLLQPLRFLTLAYPQKAINDRNIEILAESLKELPSLQSLSLDFSDAENLTNHGVEALVSSIKALSNLSSLKIWLKSNMKIDNQAISQLAGLLKSLPGLYSVDLNLVLCPRIACFDELLRALNEARNIGEVALSLLLSDVKPQEKTRLRESKVVKRMTSSYNSDIIIKDSFNYFP